MRLPILPLLFAAQRLGKFLFLRRQTLLQYLALAIVPLGRKEIAQVFDIQASNSFVSHDAIPRNQLRQFLEGPTAIAMPGHGHLQVINGIVRT